MDTHTTNREAAWRVARENQQRARQLKQPWQHYFFQCQAYLYVEADLTYENEKYLKRLIDHLEDAQAFDSHPDFYLNADPDAYARFILRKTKAPRFDEKLESSGSTLMLFVGVMLFMYACFIAIRGWQAHQTLVAAINMPVPISLLGLPLEIVLAAVLIFLIMQFIHRSAYGTEWRQPKNLLMLVGIIFMSVLFIAVPYLSLSYQVFIFNVPVWLIWLCALLYSLTQFLQRHLNITERLEHAIAARAKRQNTHADKKGKAVAENQTDKRPSHCHKRKHRKANSTSLSKAEDPKVAEHTGDAINHLNEANTHAKTKQSDTELIASADTSSTDASTDHTTASDNE
ncbi:MAG: Yip1 family protein [Aerococcus sp.]|nr:Yip1 family protein [Aerococcus sp.]